MKKSIYPPCIILLVLLLVPVTACTTKTAAEKPQDTPSRQEQPAGNTSADDAPMQPAQSAPAEEVSHTDNTMSSQSAPAATQPSKQAVQTDAVSGATIDSVSGATVSRRQKNAPAPEAAQSGTAISQKHNTPAATAGKTADGTAAKAVTTEKERSTPSNAITADKTAVSKTVEATTQHTKPTVASAAQPSKQDSSEAVGQQNDEGNSGKTAAQEPAAVPSPALAADKPAQPAAADTAAEQLPIASSTGEAVPLATADTPALSAEQNVPAYETTLADLISDFEQQGGSHGYEPPPTFHEEMLDLFSPQIFTVALSKEPETEQKPKVSRMVAVEEKQRLELTYPGHGWVYVGEQTSQQGLKYEQRKLQDENSIFMFTAEKKGDYVLHFSYFDVFTNDFITDAVAVSVSAARSTAAKSTVKAPEYQNESDSNTADSQPEKAAQAARQPSSNSAISAETEKNTAQAAAKAPQTAGSDSQSKSSEMIAETTGTASAAAENIGGTAAQTAATASEETLSSDQLLEKTRTAIAAADAGTALTYLDNFFTTAEEKLDEGWFLKGRAYELNGSARNIRLALEAYKTLTDSFPQSKYWAEADARIRYITGFYINIQ